MNARAFSFGADFRGAPESAAISRAEADAIEARAYASGREAGIAEAEAAHTGRLAATAESIAALVPSALTAIDARMESLEAEAARVALAVARTVAGQALAKHPLDAIATVAAEAFGHLRGVPHLAIRVNEALVEDVEAMTARLGRERGFEGRVVVLGEPDIPPGDARVEWADGGVLRERRRLDATIARVAAELGLTEQPHGIPEGPR